MGATINVPFPHGDALTRWDLKSLGDWLRENSKKTSAIIAGDYTIADLIDDLAAIAAGVHNEMVDHGIEGDDDARDPYSPSDL